jgi:hypothetical protein
MAALIPVSSLHAHTLALCILTHAYVRQTIPNVQLQQRRRDARATAAGVDEQKHSSATPSKSLSSHVFHSPIAASPVVASPACSSSFFSPASSAAASVPVTPAPAGFNLGLNLADAAPNQPLDGGEEQPAAFSKKSYQRLGLLLQKAIQVGCAQQARAGEAFRMPADADISRSSCCACQNGCTYDPALYASSGTDTTASPSDLSTFPSSPPRFPTLAELRALIRNNLPQQDDFNVAVEKHLVAKVRQSN